MTLTKVGNAKIATALIAFAIIAGAFFAVATPAAKAMTTQELVQLFVSLGIIPADKAAAALAAVGTNTTTTGQTSSLACPYTWTRTLKVGSTGADVKQLQMALNSWGITVSASGAGSVGMESTSYGAKTAAAVSAFQMKYASEVLTPSGLTKGTGLVGAATRAKLNALCTTGSTGTTTGGTTTGGTTTGTGLTVSAVAQPANSLAVANASRVPFTKFSISAGNGGPVTVTGVTVARVGLINKSVFTGVELLDENGNLVGTSKTFNSNDQATVGTSWTIPAGTTKTYTIAADMDTLANLVSHAGEVGGIDVVGINTSSTVTGSLPIHGAMHTVNATLSVGTLSASVSSFDPNSDQSKPIGTTAQRFAGVQLTAGSAEDVRVRSIRFYQTGSASMTDFGNLAVMASGTTYPVTVSSDGKYYTANFGAGIVLAKGNSTDVYIMGDLTGANSAGRTIEFDIDKATDIYATGEKYGYGITVSNPNGGSNVVSTTNSTFLGAAATPGTPFFSASTFTVTAGSVTTISNATSVAAQNIALNVQNQPLGGFMTNMQGEPVTVQKMVFTVASSSTTGGPLTSVSLVNQNGAVVAGPVDEASDGTLTFTDAVTLPVGPATYTLKGKVASGAANNSTITISFTPNSSNWVNAKGANSGNTVTLPGTAITLNTMTVQSAALVESISASPSAQNVVAGTSGFTFANVQLDASASGEDVRFSSVPLTLVVTGAGSDVNQLSGCQLMDSSTALNTGSNVINPTTGSSSVSNFTLDNPYVVHKGTVQTLSVMCNLSASAPSAATYKANVVSNPTTTGVTSGATVTVTGSGTGPTMTVQAGSFAVSVDASSPSYAVAAGGTTGVTMGVVKLRATNDTVTLNKLGLTLTSGAAADLTQVRIYNNSGTQIGTATFTGSNTSATSTLSTPLVLAKDADTLVTVKADIADIGTSLPGVEGDLVKIDPLNAEGVGSAGTSLKVGATAGVNGVRIYNTFPTVALSNTLSGTGMNDGKLMRFAITADSHGPVGVGKLSFSISSTTGVSVSNVQLFAFTDAGYSTPVSNQGSGTGQIGNTMSIAQGVTFSIVPATSPVQISAGQTYYFELRASITGVVSGSSVVTTLKGDSTASPASGTVASSSVSGNFQWTPNATSTASTLTSNDWTNGFGITGLPSGGLFQTRSQ